VEGKTIDMPTPVEQPIVHTFVIMAHKNAPFIEETIQSLQKQTYPSHVVLSTSTPNERILGLAEKYHLDVFINEPGQGIVADWTFAIAVLRRRWSRWRIKMMFTCRISLGKRWLWSRKSGCNFLLHPLQGDRR